MKPPRTTVRRSLAAVASAVAFALLPALAVLAPFSASAADELAPLPVKPPAPTLKGTPNDLPTGPNVEPPPEKPLPPFQAPKGVVNVAAGKKATSSVKPFTGTLDQITDGKKEPEDDQVVEMRKGRQWVQVDLGEPAKIYAIVVWHDHRYLQLFHDVIVQLADDPDFTQNVQTIYNNDVDNSVGLGIGTDKEYFETFQGRTFDAKGLVARYVRCYTAGSSLSALNVCQEIEVYALPAK
ncbi:MAG: hypothetical protein IT581_21685 [Verrucomicrobiales bacterium]|nr:hypothetical protein [Verrucomicrobiales bacterium]